jgi:predicted DsbA family dithiol-disulfide isomerase
MQILEKLGISEAVEKLSSQELEDAVLASDRYAKHDLDIHGVPYFIVGSGERRAVLRGAQSVEAIEHVLDKQISKLLVRQQQ